MLKLARGIQKFSLICNYVGIGFLPLLMMLTVVDVILRYFFNAPIRGAMEYTEFLLVIIIWLGFAFTQSIGGHISVDLIVSRLSPGKQFYFGILAYMVALAVMIVIAWITLNMAIRSFQINELGDISRVVLYPFKGLVFLGAGVLCLELITELLLHIAGERAQAATEIEEA